jgi:hypothetical protein
MRLIFMILGAVFGVFFVKEFLLSTLEKVGWVIFWETMSREIDLVVSALRIIAQTTAASKCLIGAIVGAFIGFLAKALLFKARPEV